MPFIRAPEVTWLRSTASEKFSSAYLDKAIRINSPYLSVHRLIMLENRMPLVVVIYLATVLLIFTVGLAAGESAVYWQAGVSLVMLGILVVVLQRLRLGREKTERQPSINIFLRHLVVFGLAMAARSLFIAFFNNPAEKIPIFYLVILTVLLVEGRSLLDIGISRVKWGGNVLAGLILGVSFYYLSQWFYIGGVNVFLGGSLTLVPALYGVYDLAWILATSFLLSALSEELLFRGYLQGSAEKVLGSSKALVYSAVLFGLWHTVWGIPFIGTPVFAVAYAASYMLFTSLSGIVLGVAYRSTKSLILPIFIHGLWNTFTSLTATSSQTSFIFLGDPWRPLSFGLTVLFFYLLIPRVTRFLKIEKPVKL